MGEAGFDRFLTGSGFGSHFGYFEQLEEGLSRLPLPDLVLRAWKHARWHRSRLAFREVLPAETLARRKR